MDRCDSVVWNLFSKAGLRNCCSHLYDASPIRHFRLKATIEGDSISLFARSAPPNDIAKT